MGVALRLMFLMIFVIGLTACGARSLPQASTPAGIESARSSSGYRVVLRDGTDEFIADPSRYELKASRDGPMVALRGRGFELAIKGSAVRRFTRLDANTETDLAIPQRVTIGHDKVSDGSLRSSKSFAYPVCGIDIDCGGSGKACPPSVQSCSLCPDCSAPIPSDGDPVMCFVSPCGNDGGGGVGVGIIPLDSTVTCLFDFSSDGLDCGYANKNPQPSRPNKNYAIGYVHSNGYVRLSCDISSFLPIEVIGFGIYKDASQLYAKYRDDVGPSPDYWFAPDQTGRPIPPPPPAHTSISSQYEYLGVPLAVAGHCDGAD